MIVFDDESITALRNTYKAMKNSGWWKAEDIAFGIQLAMKILKIEEEEAEEEDPALGNGQGLE